MEEKEDVESGASTPRRNLKTAYHMLRKEALRQFRENHKNDPQYQQEPKKLERRLSVVSLHEPSEDVEVEEFIQEFERRRSSVLSSGSKAPPNCRNIITLVVQN